MGSEEEDERWLMMAVLDHLQQKVSSSDGSNVDSLQEAIFAISNAYTLNIHSSSVKARYPLDGLSLPAVYKAGRCSLLTGSSDVNSNHGGSSSTTPAQAPSDATASSSNDPAFDKFLQRLRETTAFFEGVEEDSDEFKKRMSHARSKYDERIAAKKQRIERSSPSGSAGNPTPETNTAGQPTVNVNVNISGTPSTMGATGTESAKAEADIARAAELKERGNAQLKAKQFEAALKSYSEAISLDPKNAIYYSNRAAANLRLSRFSHAVDDCKKAINLDPSFVRPRERLASAYRYLGMTRQEVDALRDAISLDGSNIGFQNQLRDAEGRLAAENVVGNTPDANAPGLDANMLNMMANSMGLNVPPGIAESLANSDMLSQVGSFVRDNPAMVERFMQMMGPGATGGAQSRSNGTDRTPGS